MRACLLGMITALGIGLVGTSPTLAAPADGVTLSQLGTEQLMQNIAVKVGTVKKIKIFPRSRRFCVGFRVIRHHIRPTSRFLIRRVCARWIHR